MRYFRNNIIDKGLTFDREALKRLHSENGLAVLTGTTSMEYEMFLQKRQETYISKEPFVHGYYSSWMFGKGFPLERNISAFLARAFETGIYQKVCVRHFLLASECFIRFVKVFCYTTYSLRLNQAGREDRTGTSKAADDDSPPPWRLNISNQRKSFKL